jgi:branched-chain amino acid transport system ATP-binding protein
MTTALRYDGVAAGYGGGDVVRRIDLEVREGEVVALLGPNGAGKSTLLALASGLLAPSAGSLALFGEPHPGTRSPHRMSRRSVAHVPENRGVFGSLTVRENLALSAPGRGTRRRDFTAKVIDLFPELEPLLGRRAGLLSGGEQQMLALGRALALRPRLLLLDEMSLGLAPVIVERLLPVARTAAEEGAAVLLVEQHTDVALGSSDRAYVLVHGELRLAGRSADILVDRAALDAAFLDHAVPSATNAPDHADDDTDPEGTT